jgi:hypothetical protein
VQEVAGAAALRAAAGAHVRFTCVDCDSTTVVLGANTGSLYVFQRATDTLSLQRVVYPEDGGGAGGLGLTVSSVYTNLLRKKAGGDSKEGDALLAVKLSPSGSCCATANAHGVLCVVYLRATTVAGAPLPQPLHRTLCRDVHRAGTSPLLPHPRASNAPQW